MKTAGDDAGTTRELTTDAREGGSQDRPAQRAVLVAIARQAMRERGLASDFTSAARQELAAFVGPADASELRDLRELLWASIDNDESRDLDQLTVAESLDTGLDAGRVRIRVAIADVDSLVRKGSAIDAHAAYNTTSVYTPAAIFPMLPERLSTDLTSLNEDEDRIAVVTDMLFDADGVLAASDIYRARVRNHGKLTYRSVAAWLTDTGPAPQRVTESPDLAANLRLQDQVAQALVKLRRMNGALSLETAEAKPVFADGHLSDLEVARKNRASQLIEDFMIATNGVAARYLEAKKFPSLRRVLRSPERWQRIVDIAAGFAEHLPPAPDAVALEAFLTKRRAANPEKFADLSLTIIKLIGRGAYVVDLPGAETPGHFGLAIKDYTHSTAPNRRFPDLITQRLIKAALTGAPLPYTLDELSDLARHCTERENAATKVERRVLKSAAALLLAARIGDEFDAIVTGAAAKGTWVRIEHPPVEGRLVGRVLGLDVGARLRVKLQSTDVQRGFIDFVAAPRPGRRATDL